MNHLERLGRGYRKTGEPQAAAQSLVSKLADLEVEDVFEEGLHEFLGRFVREVSALAATITTTYLSGEAR